MHDDDVVAHVHMRAIVRLMLALQAMGNLGREATERLAARVDYVPIATDCAGLGEHGCHRGTCSEKGREVYLERPCQCKVSRMVAGFRLV